ncbi:MAG: protein rep [Clostridia bacterium]|nr:protein rep [Clostridia bacterium]
MNNYSINDFESQVKKILQKAKIKKVLNADVVAWLMSQGEFERAYRINDCATNIGITNIGGVAKIVKANFCRERLCNVCAWRRQSKFMSQMFPVMQILSQKYEFIFVTLTVKSVPLERLKSEINTILAAYDRFLKHRRVKRGWVGKVRGLEMKYNSRTKEFNPHIHILVAVEPDYFKNDEKYISQRMVREYWQESLDADYLPRCEVKKVYDTDGVAIETLKYSFKQMTDNTAMSGFYEALKSRRLVSFSGVFAETRKLLKLSDFENVLEDDLPQDTPKQIFYTLYTFDATGGIFSYYKQFEMAL